MRKGEYVWVRAPTWWTGKRYNMNKRGGYVAEHILVYCEANGLTELPSGHVVHHLNDDCGDNRLENLQLKTRAKHVQTHHTGTKREPWSAEMIERFRLTSSFIELTPEQQNNHKAAMRRRRKSNG